MSKLERQARFLRSFPKLISQPAGAPSPDDVDCRISSQARRREKQTLNKTFASQQFSEKIVSLGLNLPMQTNRQYVLLCISVRRLQPDTNDRLREWHDIDGGGGRVRKGEADQGDEASAKGTTI